jgi:hypothetical protein
MIFRKKVTKQNVYFDFLYKFYLKHFSFLEEFGEILSKMQKRLHVKYPLFLSDFKDTWMSRVIF